MNFEDLIITYDDVLDVETCKTILDRFEECSDRHCRGISGAGYNPDIKRSIDMNISYERDWKDIDSIFYDALKGPTQEYLKLLMGKTYNGLVQYPLDDSGYQIQKTEPDGFYVWHTDDCTNVIDDTRHVDSDGISHHSVTRRIATYLFYLNDGFEGGRTQFQFDGETFSVEPKAGRLLMFPSSFLYVHRCETVTSGNKYVATGWLTDYFALPGKKTCPYSREFNEYHDSQSY